MYKKLILSVFFMITLISCNIGNTSTSIHRLQIANLKATFLHNLFEIFKIFIDVQKEIPDTDIELLKKRISELEKNAQNLERRLASNPSDEDVFAAVNDINQMESQVSEINGLLFDKLFLKGNDIESFKLFEFYSNKNNPVAKYYLGLMYEEGRGQSAPNSHRACDLFNQSSKENYIIAKERYDSKCINH